MAPGNLKNIIFDFDGTIADSQSDIKESLSEAIFRVRGIRVNCNDLRIGPPVSEMIKTLGLGTSDAENIIIVKLFREIYRDCGFNKTSCYVGIPGLLQKLKILKKNLFVATNKPGYLTNVIIDKLKIDYFDQVATIDSKEGISLSKHEMIEYLIEKNELSHEKTIMIGDSSTDITSAASNGIKAVAVGYGYETGDQLMKANPDYYFETVNQLADFLLNK